MSNVVGIFNPFQKPLSFNLIEDLLHKTACLCPKPCGALRKIPEQPPGGFILRSYLEISGINCFDCRISLLTMILIVDLMDDTYNTFISTPCLAGEIHLLKEKNLICNECSNAFIQNFEYIMNGLERRIEGHY